YALDASNGTVVWGPTHLGPPVPASALPCTNIDPVGITSTPAIDIGSGVIYVVAFLGGPPHHELHALSWASGAVLFHRPVDPTCDPTIQNQRGALTLSGGYVYIPFGGRAGDCGTYHGWVVGAPAGSATGALLTYMVPTTQDSSDHGGGIWAPPGPAVDASGSLWVATGNAYSTTTLDHGGGGGPPPPPPPDPEKTGPPPCGNPHTPRVARR